MADSPPTASGQVAGCPGNGHSLQQSGGPLSPSQALPAASPAPPPNAVPTPRGSLFFLPSAPQSLKAYCHRHWFSGSRERRQLKCHGTELTPFNGLPSPRG